MSTKRRRSGVGSHLVISSKRTRIRDPLDYLSFLSDELLIRILHNLPITTLLHCQCISHRFYRLAGDSQIWKNLYYNRFVLPRALRIPGIRNATDEQALHFSSRRSKWLEERDTLVTRKDGMKTNWKGQYKLRHNWSIGACEMQEICVSERPSIPEMLVKLADGIVITVDKDFGLRAWELKGRGLLANIDLDGGSVPTCLAVDEQESGVLGIAIGFVDGGWATWKLDVEGSVFNWVYGHPPSSNGTLSAVAYSYPYVLTITETQLLSLYTFSPILVSEERPESGRKDSEIESNDLNINDAVREGQSSSQSETVAREISDQLPTPTNSQHPTLIASLKSHTSWPPLSLSIRTTSSMIIASIAYSLPTYFSGYTVGLQELHLSLRSGQILSSRLTSALPQGFNSFLSNSSSTTSPSSGSSTPVPQNTSSSPRPTTLSYSHPYILATHPDNTLTLYLCTSTRDSLSITPGNKLWGHTSSVSSAEITPRGKAVSVSMRGDELRVWELEGGLSRSSTSTSSPLSMARLKRANERLSERSVRIRAEKGSENTGGEIAESGEHIEDVLVQETQWEETEWDANKRWVGFDDECVIVLKETCRGPQALMVYDFT